MIKVGTYKTYKRVLLNFQYLFLNQKGDVMLYMIVTHVTVTCHMERLERRSIVDDIKII